MGMLLANGVSLFMRVLMSWDVVAERVARARGKFSKTGSKTGHSGAY